MNKRILVIDDFADIRKMFCYALEDTPYEVDTAATGRKGVMLHKKNKYDLIFLDLNMPGMNGVEVLRKIRKFDKEVPICIVTAFYQEFIEGLTDANNEGLEFDVTNKPITIKQIATIANETLESAKILK